MNFKKFLAVFIISLFLLSGLSILASTDVSHSNLANSPDQLSSIGETGSTSTSITYFTENAASDVSGSGSISAIENSTCYTGYYISDSNWDFKPL